MNDGTREQFNLGNGLPCCPIIAVTEHSKDDFAVIYGRQIVAMVGGPKYGVDHRLGLGCASDIPVFPQGITGALNPVRSLLANWRGGS
jgi:hypothetical protein